MKRAKKQSIKPPQPRNPVARSPLLGKGGPHQKSRGALRREANVATSKLAREQEKQS